MSLHRRNLLKSTWKERICMSQRIRIFGAVLLLLAAVLSGCAGNSASETKAQTTAPESLPQTESSLPEASDSETSTVAEAVEETASDTPTEVTYDRSAQYDAVALSDGDAIVGGVYTAIGEDESVLEASGTVTASVTGSLLQKLSGKASSADGSSFYGLNAAVRVYDKATVTLKDCEIVAEADNATGVFAYDGGVIYLTDCTVTATGGGAGGVQVAGGGTLYGNNLTVTSASKAGIRSDRGGGVMVIDGGSYTSTGSNGCPAIYSTADITVKNADCVSTSSRAVIIEGKNSVTLEDCTLSGNDQSTKEGSVRANVLLYQSMSGDAGVGVSTFTMTGGSMTSNSGAMFYCTNTASVINLQNTELNLSEDGTLLIVSAGRWGKDGSNGGDCALNAEEQLLEGDILVDVISSLSLNLKNSSYTGAITGDGDVSVTLDTSSTWTLTGDSYLTEFNGDAANVISNGYTVYVNGVSLSGTT